MRHKLLLVGVVFVTMTLFGTQADGQSAKCESVKDTDERMLCKAITSRNKSWCGFIKDQSRRAWCYAILEGK